MPGDWLLVTTVSASNRTTLATSLVLEAHILTFWHPQRKLMGDGSRRPLIGQLRTRASAGPGANLRAQLTGPVRTATRPGNATTRQRRAGRKLEAGGSPRALLTGRDTDTPLKLATIRPMRQVSPQTICQGACTWTKIGLYPTFRLTNPSWF